MERRFILLGASRGLGWATYQALREKFSDGRFLLSSRKIEARAKEVSDQTILFPHDFSVTPVNLVFLARLQEFDPTDLIYFAGGGPYGNFARKKWSDHRWALNTTFLYPAELLHHIYSLPESWPSLQNIVLIGSSIAESQADPGAASYAAAKHALKGMTDALKLEVKAPRLQLFSPGYMQTDLLPAHSHPRQNGLAENPSDAAKKLIAIIEKND